MADILITPASSLMAFTSSLNYKQTLTQEASGSLTLLGSGSTGRTDVFTVNGNNGTLFSISDDLSNSLFSVNTIAGLPVIEAFANNTVVMGQYGQNVLVVTGSNVGIGTSAPTYKLQVQGTGYFNGTLYVNGATTIEDTFTVKTQDGSYTTAVLDYSGGAGGRLKLYTDDVLRTQIGSYYGDDTYFNVGYGGNVGIGLTNPSARLDIRSYASSGATNAPTLRAFGYDTDSYFEVNNNGNNSADIKLTRSDGATMFKIDGHSGVTYFDGNVGIGITNPAAKLHVSAGDSSYSLFGPNATWGAYLYVGAGTNQSTNAIAQVITTNGNLHVDSGTSQATYINYYSQTDTYINANGGNVGVNTTAPQKKLDAVSNANDFVTVGAAQISAGQWAGIHFGYRENNTSYRKSAIVFERTDLTSGNAQGKVHILNGPQSGGGSATLSDAKLTIAENGNVGIGTTNPSFPLSVQGIAQARGGVYVTQASPTNTLVLDADNTSLHKIYTNSTVDLSLGTNSSTSQLYLKNGGNVGIGTTSPTSKLQINASTSDGIILRTTSNAEPFIALQRNSASNGVGVFRLQDGGHLYFDNGATGAAQSTKMTILAGGNVGIGTTNPSGQLSGTKGLSIVDATNAALGLSNGTNHWLNYLSSTTYRIWNNSVSEVMTILLNGNIGIGTTNPAEKLDVFGRIQARPLANGSSGNYWYMIGSITDVTNYGVANGIQVENAGQNSYAMTFGTQDTYLTGITEKMRITADGNVGIGTTVPGWKLDVAGNARIGANTDQNTVAALAVSAGQGSSTTYRDIDLHGNWAAGEGHAITANYSTGTSNIVGQMVFQHDGPGSRIKFGRLYDSGNQSTYPMELVSNGSLGNLTITGKVGIGTTSPTTKLHVETTESEDGIKLTNGGTTKVIIYNDGVIHWGDSAQRGGITWDTGKAIVYGRSGNALSMGANGSWDQLYINTSGNVGIGNTNPGYKLDVTGDIGVSGAIIDTSNNYLYWNPGESYFYAGGRDANNDIQYTPRQGIASISDRAEMASTWGGEPYYNGQVLSKVTANGTISRGKLVYLSTNGKWALADAIAVSSTKPLLGIALDNVSADGLFSVLLDGMIITAYHSQTGTATPGAPLYVATSNVDAPGYVTQDVPASSGEAVRLIGHNIYDTTSGVIIRFQPDNTWIEL